MALIRFPLSDVAELALDAETATELRSAYGETADPEPAIMFVKDDGVYLMSNSAQEDRLAPVYGRNGRLELRLPDYQTDPEKWDRVYSEAARICGGDDFAEMIPTAALGGAEGLAQAISDGFKSLVINLTSRSMTVKLEAK
jgi:hypothetical protein